jgi:hypothetical protein
VKPIVQWPLWQRLLFTNVTTAVGVCIGLASSRRQVSVNADVYIAVFTMVLMNLMSLVVVPRIHALKATGMAPPSPWRTLYDVLVERPFVTALFILQLIGVSRVAATTIQLIQASSSEYVSALPNTHAVTLRLIGVSTALAGVTCYMAGAIGLWRSRPWAWWWVLALNGLSATVTGVLQVLRLDEFLIDIPAMAVVVLLLLRPVRAEFRRVKTLTKQIAV